MASLSKALRRIRRVRREEAPPHATNFDSFRPEYRDVLVAPRDLGGDSAVDEMSDWLVACVHETGNLPNPSELRCKARAVAEERNLEIPLDSSLRDP